LNWLVLAVSCAARARPTIDPLPFEHHVQPGQIGPQIGRLRARGLACGLRGIEPGALGILLRERERLEIARPRQPLRIERGILGHLGHAHHRQGLAHQLPLERIVVDKDQRIEPDPDRLGNPPQVGGFVVPVGLKGGDMLAPQQHVRVLLEGQQGIGLVVLRADRQNHPALHQAEHMALKRQKGLPSGLPCPSAMPSRPSSPITPPHSVLSRSSTRHLADRPRRAATSRIASSP
jgi:hypothetical protein